MVPIHMMKQGEKGIIRFICGAGYLAGALKVIGVEEGVEFEIIHKNEESMILKNQGWNCAIGNGAATMILAVPVS